MASTTINGYNSGLDIQSIVESMVAAEKAPKEAQLKRIETESTAKISGVGQFRSAISDLQAILKELNKPELYDKRTAVSSDAKLVTASTTKEALTGTYKIDVESLASASKVATAPVSGGSSFTYGQGGSLTISVGSNQLKSVSIADGATLKDVRDAINSQLGSEGVSANIVTDPSTNTSRLVLSSNKTGSGNDLTVVATGGSEFAKLSVPAYDSQNPAAGVSYMSMASNAKFSVDGLSLESATNNVTGAIEGVTFNLLGKTEAGKPITLSIDQDKSAVKATITKFVDAYNGLMEVAKELTGVTSVGEGKAPVTGALVGDSSVRNLITAMRNELVSSTGDSGIRILTDLGITTQQDGTLKVDDTKLSKALNDNFDSVGAYFSGDTGLMKRLDNKLDPYTQASGILEKRLDGLQDTIASVDKQRTALNLRVTAMQERLLKQFTAMDTLIGQLNQTSDRLSQTLASLPGVTKD